jgi:hypothetical protein
MQRFAVAGTNRLSGRQPGPSDRRWPGRKKDVALLGEPEQPGADPFWGGVVARVVTWKKTVRRRLAIGAAGLTVGAAILFVAAVMPASAHTPLLSGHTVCSNGQHVITWSIGNDFHLPMTITSARATKGTASYAVTGYQVGLGPSGTGSDTTSARTVVPAAATGSVTLTVHARWTDGFTTSRSTSVALLGPCMGSTTTTLGSQGSTVPPPTTTPPTTGGPPTTTTSTIGSQGSTLPPPTTSSTVASLGSTLAPPTTGQAGPNSADNGGTPIAPQGGPSGPPGGASIARQLPFTGSGYAGPILGAGSLLLGGIGVAIGSARKRRRETV